MSAKEPMKEEEKLLAGKIFSPVHPELVAIKLVSHNLCTEYSQSYETETEKREQILDKLLKSHGKGTRIQGPIFFNYGCHTTIGDSFFANYNFTVLDDAPVTIGDHVMMGPNVTIATPVHPLIAEEWEKYPCYAKPVTIGNYVWIASGVTVCPGVTIGDRSVIGAGSVVTKDIPEGVFAAGSPCRVIRPITEQDSIENMPWLL